MLTHITEWPRFNGPLIAFGVTLGLAVVGRFLRVGPLAAAASGMGVIAGWYVVTGRLWVVAPSGSVNELTEIAAVALIVALLCTWRGGNRVAMIGMLLAAMIAGWFVAGAPREQAALRAAWPTGLGVAAFVLLLARSLTDRALDPLRPVLAGLTLAAAFHVAAMPPVWTQLALVPGLAALAMFALPPMPGPVALPVAVDIGALASLSVIALGRLPRLGFGPVDAAAVSPLLAVWLLPRTQDRLSFTGRAAPLAGGVLAGTIAVGCVWLLREILHR
jgi:hypothetical protein